MCAYIFTCTLNNNNNNYVLQQQQHLASLQQQLYIYIYKSLIDNTLTNK